MMFHSVVALIFPKVTPQTWTLLPKYVHTILGCLTTNFTSQPAGRKVVNASYLNSVDLTCGAGRGKY